MDFEYLQNLVKPIICSNGRISGAAVKKYNNIIIELDSIDGLDEFKTVTEKVFAIFNKITKIPRCLCGQPTPYVKGSYNTYCSRSCDFARMDLLKKRQQTILEKYGVQNVSQLKEVQEKIRSNNLVKYGAEHTGQVKEFRDKAKITNLEKYGFEHPNQNKEQYSKTQATNLNRYGNVSSLRGEQSLEKTKQTNIEKYGVENPSQCADIRDKIKKTNLEKYGCEYPIGNEEVKQKVKQINLERYGVEYPQTLEKFKQKAIQTNLVKYGVEHGMQCGEIRQKAVATNLKKYGETSYSKTDKHKNTLRSIFTERFKLNVLPLRLKQLEENNIYPNDWELSDYINSLEKCQFLHTDCNKIFEASFNNGLLPRCPKCHFLHNTSQIELKLRNDLIELLGEHRVDYTNRTIIAPKELDIVVDNKLAIEVNGTYWHSEDVAKYPIRHKSELSPIQILHFWDFELENKYDICKSMILNKLGLTENRIHARKCDIREVPKDESTRFLDNNHLQGSINSPLSFGLYHNKELVQLISFGKPRFNNNYTYEIHRIATKLNTVVVGGTSKLFKHIMNNLDGSFISYADKRYSDGNIYRTLGFNELKDSSPNYYWVKKDIILSRYKTQKHKLKDLLGWDNFNSDLSEKENMQLNGFHKIYDCGNKIFIKN